jgi:hypothetical protein
MTKDSVLAGRLQEKKLEKFFFASLKKGVGSGSISQRSADPDPPQHGS